MLSVLILGEFERFFFSGPQKTNFILKRNFNKNECPPPRQEEIYKYNLLYILANY